jgi:hypothetical protein
MPTCHEQVCYLKMAWNLHGKQSFLESLEMEEKILELAEIGVIGVAGVEVSERVMTVSHTRGLLEFGRKKLKGKFIMSTVRGKKL